MKFSVSDDGIKCLEMTACELEDAYEMIAGKARDAGASIDEYQQRLGPHVAELRAALETIIDSLKQADDALLGVRDKLYDIADAYQELVDDDPFAALNGGGGSSTGRAGSSAASAPAGVSASQRSKAVRQAWALERRRVLEGKATRQWTIAQQQELIKYGRVSGFEGQHMMNVNDHPEYAEDPLNIQFLTYEEHFYGAHRGNWKNETNGRYVPEKDEFVPFREGEKVEITPFTIDEKDRYIPEDTYGVDDRRRTLKASRDRVKNK